MNRKVFTLIMFTVLVFLFGARAATAQWISLPKASELGNSVTSFFPVIFKSSTVVSASPPSGVLYIFPSTATTDGDAGGRSGIHQICPSEDSDAHFCSVNEIENSWDTTGIFFSDPFPDSWVEKTDENWAGSVDCSGWKNNTSSVYGASIESNARLLDNTNCNTTLPVACCKQIP
jgi:hypothetical protein